MAMVVVVVVLLLAASRGGELSIAIGTIGSTAERNHEPAAHDR